jgi:hypothetical protein
MGVLAETLFQSEIEESTVEAIERRCCRAKSDDGWFQLGFAFQFLIGLIDTVQIRVALLPCPVQLCPEMVENLLQPALTREFPGADFVVVIHMRLLELHPVVAETASKQMGPANVVLGMHEERKAGFSVVGRHVEHGIVLKSTLDAWHENCLKVRLGVQFGEQFAERVEKGDLPLDTAWTSEDVCCRFDGCEAGRAQIGLSLSNAFHVPSGW